jgi:hypothetical protein
MPAAVASSYRRPMDHDLAWDAGTATSSTPFGAVAALPPAATAARAQQEPAMSTHVDQRGRVTPRADQGQPPRAVAARDTL